MNNTELIKWGSEISKKTNHELIGMLYQRIEEMRIIFSILNKREEEKMFGGENHGKERKTKRRAKTKAIELKPKDYLPKSRFFKT